MKKLVLTRLDEYLDTIANGRNQNQFGFRYDKSTLDTMKRMGKMAGWTNQKPIQLLDIYVLVLIDVKNPFNSLP